MAIKRQSYVQGTSLYLSSEEPEAGGSQVQSLSGLQTEIKARLGNLEGSYSRIKSEEEDWDAVQWYGTCLACMSL